MRIFTINDRLVEEIGSVNNEKVVFFKYIKQEDKDKCPHCYKTIDIEHSIVENCLNWISTVRPVSTIRDSAIKNGREIK